MVSLKEKYPLEKRKPLKKTIERVWFFIPLYLFLILPIGYFFSLDNAREMSTSFGFIFLIVPLIILIVIILSVYIYELFYLKHYFYDNIGKNLIIKKGVFSINEITIPFNRLQDVYVDQDVLDRIFSLYDLHVSSATYISGWLSHIDGLNKENSEIIKKVILKNIGKHGK